jgi:hypothetical protein
MFAENPRGSNMPKEIVTVTPELAEKWLVHTVEGGFKNRLIQWLEVERYARDMSAGRWKLNGCPILIDLETKVVYDGQHRLLACKMSGVPFTSAVWYGDKNDVDTIDRQRVRTIGHILDMKGEKNSNTLAAGALIIWKYATMKDGALRTTGSMTCQEVERFVEVHPELRDAVAMAGSFNQPLVPTHMILLTFLVGHHSALEPFLSSIHTGAGLKMGSPAWRLRDRSLADKLAKRKPSKMDKLVIMVKAWNAVACGAPIRQLKYVQGERFPLVEGARSVKPSALPARVKMKSMQYDERRLADVFPVNASDQNGSVANTP